MARMDEKPDENPYRAPQTDSPVARRSVPPNVWIAVVIVAGHFAANRMAFLLPIPIWAVFLVGVIAGTVIFLAVVLAVKTFRPHWLNATGRQRL
jgi:hypothetical protein